MRIADQMPDLKLCPVLGIYSNLQSSPDLKAEVNDSLEQDVARRCPSLSLAEASAQLQGLSIPIEHLQGGGED